VPSKPVHSKSSENERLIAVFLFAFDGSPTFGPFYNKEQALRAVDALVIVIVEADTANPEI
jgi:hypothetical protein